MHADDHVCTHACIEACMHVRRYACMKTADNMQTPYNIMLVFLRIIFLNIKVTVPINH